METKPFRSLTPREQQVLQHLLQGQTSKKIAQALQIQPGTVENYVNALKKKFDCCSRKQLVVRLMQAGLDATGFETPAK